METYCKSSWYCKPYSSGSDGPDHACKDKDWSGCKEKQPYNTRIFTIFWAKKNKDGMPVHLKASIHSGAQNWTEIKQL